MTIVAICKKSIFVVMARIEQKHGTKCPSFVNLTLGFAINGVKPIK
jgi:hypothetical protein